MKQESKSYLADYNLLKKCLHILLNDDYLEMVVIRPEVLRNVTNIYAHVKGDVCNEQIRQTIQYVEALYERVELRPIKGNIEDLVNTLNDILQHEDDFYFKWEDSRVEHLIDNHINGELDKYNEDLKNYTDMRMLLEHLDSL